MRKIILMILTFVFIATSSYAQRLVKGKVTSKDDGASIPGVNILVEGTMEGVVTDADGKYSISVKDTDILIFSFIGYETIKEAIGKRDVINIVLVPAVSTLEEIVVVGYGTTMKKEITGAISVAKSEDFATRTAGSLQEMLAGIVPGTQVTSNGGAPGSGATLLVRGISTISTSNAPIFVVDGNPVEDIEFLNPKDIESVQVLKDASAASIYGSRGSNGVIIVTTKQAKEGVTRIEFNAKYGVQTVAKKPQMANATEYAKIRNAVAQNENSTLPYPNPETLGSGTDWWNELTQVAPIQDYLISVSRGSEDMQISSSLGYFSQDGIVKGGGYDRLTYRLNSNFNLAPWFKLGSSISFSNSKYKNGPNLVGDLLRLEPVTPVYLPDFEQVGRNEFSIFSPTITDVPNAAGVLARNFSSTSYSRFVGNLNANIKILPNLHADLLFGVYNSNWENDNFSPTYNIEPSDMSNVNSVNRSHNNRYKYVSNNIITYDKKINDHEFKVMGGITLEAETHRTLSGSGTNLPSNKKDLRYLNASVQGFRAGGTDEDWSLLSYLGRINYAYRDKYFLQSNFRVDGSSKFPVENQWAMFPSVSAGWAVSEEGFLKDVSWIEFLKVRAAWGQIGNQDIPIDARQSNLQNVYYVTGPGQTVQVGTAPASIGNDGLIWETIEDINMGVDFSMLSGQLEFTFDIYKRSIKDMLLTKQLPSYVGLGFGQQWANVGEMETKGFEFQIKYAKVISSDISLNLGLTVSNSRSKMVELNGQDDVYWAGNDQRLNLLGYTTVGGTPGAFYGWVTDGIFQTQIEANNYTDNNGNKIQPLAQPGDFRFVDLNNDGTINDLDRKVIGNPEALFTYGVNFGLQYKRFSLSGLFTGKVGGDLLSPVKAYTHSGSGSYNSYAGMLRDAWSGPGTSNSQPRILNNDRNQNFRYSDYYIQDGTYLRIKNIQLSYSLPASVSQKIGTSKLVVFANVENLFTITNYDGMDPDIGGSATLRGVDWGNYPLPRILTGGINVSF